MACAITLIDLGVKSRLRTATYVLTLLTLAAVAVLQFLYADAGVTLYAHGQYGGERPHGQLAQVLRHRCRDGHPGLRRGPTRPTATCCAAANCSA